MAKSKTKKSKIKPIDDEELQVKAQEEEATEVDVADAEADENAFNLDDEPATELADEDDEAVTELADEDAAAGDTELDEEAAEPPDDDDTAAAEADDDDTPPDDDEEASVDEGPKAPPAKISKLSIALILLNWIAAPAFLVFAYLDHAERTKYTYRTLVNYVQIYGLPLRTEESLSDKDYTAISMDTRPLLNLTTEQLKETFKKRAGTYKQAITSNTDFAPFEETLDKRVPYRLRPSDMKNADLLRDVFQDVPDKVETLEDEIVRLQTKLPADIDAAAKEVKEAIGKMKDDEKRTYVKKSLSPYSWDTAEAKKIEAGIDAATGAGLDARLKRTIVRKVLFTIAWNVHQIKNLDDKLIAAKDADLDGWLDDAIQRRLYYDILAPINVFRPGDISDIKNYKVEKLADRDAYPLDKVKEFMDQRLKAAIADKYDLDVHLGEAWDKEKTKPEALQRSSIEKRHKIAFILFTLSQVTVPNIERKLYERGIERAQVVSGLYEFTNASIYYVRALRVLEERITSSIYADRQGVIAGLKGNAASFTAEYELEIDRLAKIVEQIDTAEKRLQDLQEQRDHFQKTYAQRAAQHKEILDKLLVSRKNTAKYIEELREKQDQLHNALIELSEAGDRNFRLEAEIRALELSFVPPPKKGKKQP